MDDDVDDEVDEGVGGAGGRVIEGSNSLSQVDG